MTTPPPVGGSPATTAPVSPVPLPPADGAPAGPPAGRFYPSLRAAWIPLAALCLAFFVEMVDNTLMSIALPTIGRDLGGGTLSLQWVAAAYSQAFSRSTG